MDVSVLSYNLKECYSHCNFKYFNNILPPEDFIELRWNFGLGINAGMCFRNYKQTFIELNPTYLSLYPEEFESILVHEMIHLISLEHDKKFLEEANRITKMGLPITVNCKHWS